jgi:cytochrome c-type biogenesis protein
MPDTNVSFLWAFAAGFVSFLGPCVLPLIPGFLSFISGLSAEELEEGRAEARMQIFVASVLFVLGFSLVFMTMGASASLVGGLLLRYRDVLNKVAAVMIIIFGLSLIGLFSLPGFRNPNLHAKIKRKGLFSVVFLGMAFAVGWTPCVGPILTAILTYASTTGTVRTGMALLATYSLGLGIPFILSGLLFNRFLTAFGWLRRRYQTIAVVSGLLLVAMGVLILTGQIVYLNSWLRGIQSSGAWNWTSL